MKKKSLLLGLIFSLLGLGASAQVMTKYQLGFESSDAARYTVTGGTAAVQSSIHSSGSSALKITHTGNTTYVELDTIDLSDNPNYQYCVLEFMHICNVSPTSTAAPSQVAVIETKRVNQSTWTQQMGSGGYDRSWGGGCNDFGDNSSFSTMSYGVWQGGIVDNTWWKKERFQLWSVVTGASQLQRKLQIRFVLYSKTTSTPSDKGWYLDNINVKASVQSLAIPVVNMLNYPDLHNYPHSRAARIESRITTPVSQGMHADSIYLMYRYGHDDSIRYTHMSSIPGIANSYRGIIPFEGYDTTVYYRLVARDATFNHNKRTYPDDEASWAEFCFVRGENDSTVLATQGIVNNITAYPFSNTSSDRYQFYYDSATMARAGYGPGALTRIQYLTTSSVNRSSRSRYQIKFHNVDNNYTVPVLGGDGTFYSDAMKVAYDSSLVVTQNANTVGTINLQDTFFYAGKGILMQITTNNGTSDPAGLRVQQFATATGGPTLSAGYQGFMGFDPFTSSTYSTGSVQQNRPNYIFTVKKNMPLIHDAGVSGFIHPSATVSADASTPNNVVVWLKNYGQDVINNIRVYYQVDDSACKFYDWSGTLNGFDSVQVTLNTTQHFAAGHHFLKSWVDDSLTSVGIRYRDHEPYNDTSRTRFVSCAGAMSGIRTVGSPTADFATLEQFIYSVNQCGVNGALRVKLAPGNYRPETFLPVPGSSATNYIQYEPDTNMGTGIVAFVNATPSNADYLVNLRNAKYTRFKNITFRTHSVPNFTSTSPYRTTEYGARMSVSSVGIQFINCTFVEEQVAGAVGPTTTFTTSHIFSAGADSMMVDGCTFVRSNAGINLTGPAQDEVAHGNIVRNCTFVNQTSNAIIIRNQQAPIFEHNLVNPVTTNASFTVIVQHCYGPTRIVRNTIASTSGASCLGISDLHGTSTNYAVVANNMIVSNDDGTSNMLTTALNVIKASYTKVVYNSVKLTAPTRDGIAAATLGGDTIGENYFYNNIITCFDRTNFAFNYLPFENRVNYIGNNIYYSRSGLLNKYDNSSCTSLTQWLTHCINDTLSQEVNPGFLNTTPTDLRSYSQYMKNHGVPIPEVTNDINDTLRSTTATCVGAFEFSALDYDFQIASLDSPAPVNCGGGNSIPLNVVIVNTGVQTYNSNTMTLGYKRASLTGTSSVNGTAIVNTTIDGNDTVLFATGINVPIPPNGMKDTVYTFTLWLHSTLDPNPMNDTSVFVVHVNYAPTAPDSITKVIPYGFATTVVAQNGLDTWYPEVYTSGRQHKSAVYWYRHPDSNAFYRGDSLRTGILYADTNLYIRQKRDLPLVKIMQVQINRTGSGATYPMPFYMGSQTNLAVQLTNVGDYPADITGDTLITVSDGINYNNKKLIFPRMVLQPGQSFVVQFANISHPDSAHTLGTGQRVTPNSSTKLGILYLDGTGVKDAVALNGITANAAWTSQGSIPSTIWNGDGITLNDGTAGVYRKAWPSNPASLGLSANYWQQGDSVHSMNIGTTDENMIMFRDNGCLSDYDTVHILMSSIPNVDVFLDSVSLPRGCSLTSTNVEVTVHNYGVSAANNITLHYSVNGTLQGTETISSLAAHSASHVTFSTPLDMTVTTGDSTYSVVVWADHSTGDMAPLNDTVRVEATSYLTPAAPDVPAFDTISYATMAVLHPVTNTGDSIIWYDHDMHPLDSGFVFTSATLYAKDSFYATRNTIISNYYHIGALGNTNTATGFPSPYNHNKKYVKEQYIFTADELAAAGHNAGSISSISFFLDTLCGGITDPDTVHFSFFKVAMGATSKVNFEANNDWLPTTTVLNDTAFMTIKTREGWYKHNFNTPFLWDGVSNIVVQVVRGTDVNVNSGSRVAYTTTSTANTTLSKNDNSDANIENYTNNGTRNSRRPDITFGFADYGCEGPAAKTVVVVTDIPGCDGLLEFTDLSHLSSCGNIPLQAVVRNNGSVDFGTFAIDYWIDSTHHTVNIPAHTIAARSSDTITVDTVDFTPGRHILRLALTVPNDTVQLNDTIQTNISVSFCAGHYTIGATTLDTTYDYPDFTSAINTLNDAGVAGAVFFDVQNGIYQERINLKEVAGASNSNSITFQSASGNAADVVVKYATTQNGNSVVNIDTNAGHFWLRGMTLTSRPDRVNFGTVVRIANATDIHLVSNVIRPKGVIDNKEAVGVNVEDNSNFIYIDSCVLDSGYYGVQASMTTGGLSAGLNIRQCTISNFKSEGIHTRLMDDVNIVHNNISSHNVSRELMGIFVAEHTGSVKIERNNIVLYDTKNFARRGIRLNSVSGASSVRSIVSNNMISLRSNTATLNKLMAGIIVDSSTFVDIYFNTIRIHVPGRTGRYTSAFGALNNSNNLRVQNNVFDNRNRGYVLWADRPDNIDLLDYNVYFNVEVADTLPRFAFWGVEANTFAEYRNKTGKDVHSLAEMPYYYNDTNLHFATAQFCEKAQYQTSVATDLDGDIRPQIPAPSIGADEPVRYIHDVAMMDVLEPGLFGVDIIPTDNVESDTLRVVAVIYNNGSSMETNLTWEAHVKGCATCTTGPQHVDEILAQQRVYDTAFIPMPIGVIDTQELVSYVTASRDADRMNDTVKKFFFVDPAFNFQTEFMFYNDSITGWMDENNHPIHGCRLSNMPVQIQVKNVGRKTLKSDFVFSIGYQGKWWNAPSGVPALGLSHTEQRSLSGDLAVNASEIITFNTPANVYPTGAEKDLNVKLRSFITFNYDQKPINDTSNWVQLTSKYTPNRPEAPNLTLNYATWDTIFATQTDNPAGGSVVHRPIRWYDDSTHTTPFKVHTNYPPSTWWETPQYFTPQTYYLNCISTTGCTSYYQPVTVNLNPRVAIDMSIQKIEEPYSKVYLDNDTVKVRIINYGTTAASNFPVTYVTRPHTTGRYNYSNLLQTVTETCTATIAPGQSYVFKFDSLAMAPPPGSTYDILAWTGHASDPVCENDTIRYWKEYINYPEQRYVDSLPAMNHNVGLDITYVSFAGLNNTVSPSGHNYIEFANRDHPEYPVLNLIKGTTDTLIVGVENSDDFDDDMTDARLYVLVDFNRDGVFNFGKLGGELIYNDTIKPKRLAKIPFTYPFDFTPTEREWHRTVMHGDTAFVSNDVHLEESRRPCLGNLRMRVFLLQGGTDTIPDTGYYKIDRMDFGCIHDYLLHVENEPVATNAALYRVVSPLDHFITEDTTTIKLAVANKGGHMLSGSVVHYVFRTPGAINPSNSGEVAIPGTVDPGQSIIVSLPARHLPTGTTTLLAWVSTPGDTISSDDTLRYNWHRFKVRELPFVDDFEPLTANEWYAPQYYTKYSENVWQRGIPNKSVIMVARNVADSDTCALVTDLTNTIAYGQKGNVSIIYTPIFDIAQMRPDTLSFYIQRAMTDTLMFMKLQYWNYQNKWIDLSTGHDPCWYNGGEGFIGSSSSAYERVWISTQHFASEMQQRLQFRIVFTARPGAAATDGVSVDDFNLVRAQRAIDVGVSAITYPTEPRFGETVYPKVLITNYGYDVIHNVTVAYDVYGLHLPKVGTLHSEEGIPANGGVQLFTFPDPFIVRSDFPDTFSICAYTTVNSDIIWDNDSTCEQFYLTPLENDMGMYSFLSPTDRIVAGDSIVVTTRVRNYGQSPVSSAEVTYVFNNAITVTESIDFEAMLGRPLRTFEYFNYTFHQKCRASMGTMYITAYTNMANDNYIYNDTISKSFRGLAAIIDLAAKEIVLDSSDHQTRLVQLVVDNRGALGANNFEVGFWIDNNPATLHVEHYRGANPLPSLQTLNFVFDTILNDRAGGYPIIQAYVRIANDNDSTNDTTNRVVGQTIDLMPTKVQVQENESDSCKVRIKVRNIGNSMFYRALNAEVVLNGTRLRQRFTHDLNPGVEYTLPFSGTVPKSPTRTYVGSCRLISPPDDGNAENNETSVVEVLNYFDTTSAPLVDTMNVIRLEQNYPNPYNEQTNIEFYLPASSNVTFFVVDGMGRVVHRDTKYYPQGANAILFNDNRLGAGTFYYGIEVEGCRLMRKMVHVR